MAEEFVSCRIQPGKVVVFIKPSCTYCRRTQELLSQLPFKQGLLEFVDITATSDTGKIQNYLEQFTGARTVPRVFIDHDRVWLRIHSMTPKMFFLLGTCLLLFSICQDL
uniref:Glutaredoxin domain-containing protein n=1 Tax=Suricata suricatta TaxID=37032 RepID=A0A673UTP8_SURSU